MFIRLTPEPGDAAQPLVARLLGRPDLLRARVEEQVVGPGLLSFVAELEAARGLDRLPADLPEPLRRRAAEAGLVGLADDEFRLVMDRPRNLLALQREVLLSGGVHWDDVMRRSQADVPGGGGWYRHPLFTHALAASLGLALALPALWQARSAEERAHELRQENEQLRQRLAEAPPAPRSGSPGVFINSDPYDLPPEPPADLPPDGGE